MRVLTSVLLALALSGCSQGKILLHDRFDDAGLWKVGPVNDPDSTCGAVDLGGQSAFALVLDKPRNMGAPTCMGARMDTLDLTDMDAAWMTLTYDVSEFDLGGDYDEADLLVAAQAGIHAAQVVRTWRGGYDDGPLTGTIGLDLERLVGLDEPVQIELGLRLFSCPDVTADDCGVGANGPQPLIAFDDLVVEAVPARGSHVAMK